MRPGHAAPLVLLGALLAFPTVASADGEWLRSMQGAREALAGGDYPEAVRRLQAAERRVAGFEPQDWRRAGTLHNLGVVELARGDLPAARAALDAAAERYRSLFGDRSEPLAGSHIARGELALAERRSADAGGLFEQALASLDASQPDSAAQRTQALLGMARAAEQSGDSAGQRDWLREAATAAATGERADLRVRVALAEARAALATGDAPAAAAALDAAATAGAADRGDRGALAAAVAQARGAVLLAAGQPGPAAEQLGEAVQSWESSGAREPPEMVDSLVALARALAGTGAGREAESAMQRALAAAQRNVVADHPLSIRTLHASALLALELGNPRDALNRARRLLELRPGSTDAAVTLAAAQHVAGDAEAAIRTLERLPDTDSGYGGSDAGTAADAAARQIDIGRLLLAMDRPRQSAERHASALMRLDEAGLGEHPLRVEALHGQALAVASTDGPAQAADAIARALQAARRIAPDGVLLARTLRLQARAQRSAGQLAAAAETLDEALRTAARSSGERAGEYARVLLAQGLLAADAGAIEDAQVRLATALGLAQKVHGGRHPRTAEFSLALASAQLEAGKYQDAASTLRGSASALDGAVATAAHALLSARVEASQSRIRQADELLARSLQTLLDGAQGPAATRMALRLRAERAHLALHSGRVAEAAGVLGPGAPDDRPGQHIWRLARAQVLAASGKASQALALLDDAGATAGGGVDGLQLTLARVRTLRAADRPGDALRAARALVDDSRARLGDGHPLTIAARLERVAVERQAGRFQDAEATLRQADDSVTASVDHVRRIDVLLERAALVRDQGQPGQALALYTEARGLLEKSLRGEHPRLAEVSLLQARALLDARRDGEASTLLARLVSTLQRQTPAPATLLARAHLLAADARLQAHQLDAVDAHLQSATALTEGLAADHPLRLEAGLLSAERALAAARHEDAQTAIQSLQEMLQGAPPAWLARLARLSARLAAATGEQQAALDALYAARSAVTGVLGLEHPLQQALAADLAGLLTGLGRWTEAEDELLTAADALRAASPGSLQLLEAAQQRARLQLQAGRIQDAVASAEDAVRQASERWQAEHPLVASALGVHARALAAAGQYEAAEVSMRRARSMHEQLRGELHPDTIEDTLKLARVHVHRGRDSEARQLLERTRASLQRAGAGASDAAAALELDLAWLDHAQARYSQALEAFSELARTRPAQASAAHAGSASTALRLHRLDAAQEAARAALQSPDVSSAPWRAATVARLALAGVALRRGQLDVAREQFETARSELERQLGGQHPAVARTLQRIGRSWLQAGQGREASSVLEQALAGLDTTLGAAHPLTMATRLDLVHARLASGDADAAAGELQALQTSQESPPAVQMAAASARAALAARGGDLSAAVEQLERAVSIGERSLGVRHPLLTAYQGRLAAALRDAGRGREAEPLLRRALATLEASLGEGHPDVAPLLGHLGGVHLAQGRRGSAQAYFERQLEVLTSTAGADDTRRVAPLLGLARLHGDAGQLQRAVPLLREAHRVALAGHGDHTLTTADTAAHLAAALVQTGSMDDARSLYSQALRVYEREAATSETVSGRLHDTVRSLAALHLLGGDDRAAAELLRRLPEGGAESSGTG